MIAYSNFLLEELSRRLKKLKPSQNALFKDWQAERRKGKKRWRTEDLEEPYAKKMKMIDDESVCVNPPKAENLPVQEPTPSFNPYK